jgi:undecaprenyl-diphosphatase
VELSWFESLVYGLISGLTEFLPVSSAAHQALVLKLFGHNSSNCLVSLFVHCAVLLALYMDRHIHIQQLRREVRLAAVPKRRRKRQPDQGRIMEVRLLRNAVIPMLLGFLIYGYLRGLGSDLHRISLFLLLNGVVMFLPVMFASGNKDARNMAGFDSLLLGLCSVLGLIPGFSRVGVMISMALIRGVDKENALNWSLLLTIPAMICYGAMDLFALFTGGLVSFGIPSLLGCVLAAAAAFLGTRLAIRTMRSLVRTAGFSGFSYYCWGAALFSFIMYLSI